jgi:stearoyl-CoA desaturase (delta-9 desaturase)
MFLFLVAFVLTYTWGVLGISLGYHRGLTHRSFKMNRWLEYFFVIGAYLVFEGGPIFWVASHRLHHRYSDLPGDPHSPRDGFWHAFLGWMSKPIVIINEEQYKTVCPDLYRDPLYVLLHAGGGGRDGWLCLAINVVFRIGLLLAFGPAVFFGNVLASAAAFVAPLLVNSVCHLTRFGYQNFPTSDLSRNVWFVALLSFGEGWHNNHHEYPVSARHGMRADEFDFSYLVLKLLTRFGGARDIRVPKDLDQIISGNRVATMPRPGDDWLTAPDMLKPAIANSETNIPQFVSDTPPTAAAGTGLSQDDRQPALVK